MTAVPVLTPQLLDRFDAALQRANVGTEAACAAGLSDERIDELFASLGVDCPDEARLWWRWKNGRAAPSGPECWLTPRREHLALEIAVDSASRRIALQRRIGANLDDTDRRIPPVSGKPVIDVELGGGRDAPSPLRCADESGPEYALPSLGAMIERWCWMYEEGIWYRDAAGEWTLGGDWERVPQEWRESGFW
jgi:hypothetical protein